jgi:hypothetical protein
MTNKILASAIVAGVIGGYVTMLYAVIQWIVLINQSYLLSLAM